jgi:hypothetical protein
VRPDPPGHFEAHTGRDGVTLACTSASGAMVAYGVLGMDSAMAAHLAGLLGDAPGRFAVLDGAAALPQWRGYGLHQAAIDQRVRHAAACARTIIGATVSPHNLRALRSMLHAGFTIGGAALMYGGLERLLMRRDTLAPARGFAVERMVPAADMAGHQNALGDGLLGFALHQHTGGAWSVCYG